MRFYFVAFWAILGAVQSDWVAEWDQLTLLKDRAVDITVGPEDAVYCKLEDSLGYTVFEGFGKCRLALERVTADHSGIWRMTIGLPGTIFTKSHYTNVTVREAEPKAVVSTSVVMERPALVLSCSVNSTHNVSACSFSHTRGSLLIAPPGVVDQTNENFVSEVNEQGCTIRFNNPGVTDLGIWRCAVDTEGGTYYGFLSVICPWLMQDPEIQASVVTEPVLKADRSSVSGQEGDGITMSCSVQAPIRYCYFRASNGTVFSVKPATSSPSMEYVGGGFDAGECGVRFHGLVSRDSGSWSCHVGLYNQTEEQRARFTVYIHAPIVAFHYKDPLFYNELVVEVRVNPRRSLEYCRFVRIDGLGFTSDNVPYGFIFQGSLEEGICRLWIKAETMLNLHPWTVATKIRGQDEELSVQTTDNLLWEVRPEVVVPVRPTSMSIWIIALAVGVSLLIASVLLVPKKNRKWTQDRASQLRNSLRNSFKKPKIVENA